MPDIIILLHPCILGNRGGLKVINPSSCTFNWYLQDKLYTVNSNIHACRRMNKPGKVCTIIVVSEVCRQLVIISSFQVIWLFVHSVACIISLLYQPIWSGHLSHLASTRFPVFCYRLLICAHRCIAQLVVLGHFLHHVSVLYISTVKPPNREYFGDGPFVPCREVVLFSEVLF